VVDIETVIGSFIVEAQLFAGKLLGLSFCLSYELFGVTGSAEILGLA
jgi:hypothetical protein